MGRGRTLVKGMAAGIFSSVAFLRTYRPIIRRVRRPHAAVIVNFHNFHDSNGGFFQKGPTVHTHVQILDRILGLLKKRFELLSLDDLVHHLESKTPLNEDSVVITMDDGYESNLNLGLPILQKHAVPATLFIATGYMGTNELLPMDRIDYLLQKTKEDTLNWAPIGKESIPLNTHENRRLANIALGEVLKTMSTVRLNSAFKELADHLNVDLGMATSDMLSWDQVKQIVAGGVAIGSHAVSHTCMTCMKPEDAVAELNDSGRMIEQKIGSPPRHFAFPNGMAEDFNDHLRDEARLAGYRSVASVESGVNIPGITDPYRLQRVGLVGSPKETMLYIERLFNRDISRLESRANHPVGDTSAG